MTTLRKRTRKTMQNITNLNEKCGDVRYCIQLDKRVYALHCLHCSQVCLQWDTFINHMEQEHGEDLYLDPVRQPEDDEMEIQIENDDKSKKSTLINDELNDSDHSAFDDLLESEDSSNPLCLQSSLKIENVDCSPNLTMFDYINTAEPKHTEADKNNSEMNSQIEKMTRCGSNSSLENNSCENCKHLSRKIDRLQESVNSLCKIVQQQHAANLSAFAEIKVATAKLLRMETSIINYFPVTSTQGLQNLEEHIRDDNRELFASTMSILWRNCVGKNLDNILDPKIVMDFNIDGSHGKQRLKDYKNFYIALIDSIQRLPSLGLKDPEMTLRQAMQLCKKKQFRLSALNKNSEEDAN